MKRGDRVRTPYGEGDVLAVKKTGWSRNGLRLRHPRVYVEVRYDDGSAIVWPEKEVKLVGEGADSLVR
jgi:hypothetical protein